MGIVSWMKGVSFLLYWLQCGSDNTLQSWLHGVTVSYNRCLAQELLVQPCDPAAVENAICNP